MTEQDDVAQQVDSGLPVAVVMILLIVIAVALSFPASNWLTSYSVLAKCDEGAKKYLKAPSTYNRVSPVPSFEPLKVLRSEGEMNAVEVSYDASNSFGVPIRSTGICMVSKDRSFAIWHLSEDDIKKMMGVE